MFVHVECMPIVDAFLQQCIARLQKEKLMNNLIMHAKRLVEKLKSYYL